MVVALSDGGVRGLVPWEAEAQPAAGAAGEGIGRIDAVIGRADDRMAQQGEASDAKESMKDVRHVPRPVSYTAGLHVLTLHDELLTKITHTHTERERESHTWTCESVNKLVVEYFDIKKVSTPIY